MRNRISALIVLFLGLTLYAQIPAGYYDTATGSGYTLKTQLHNIIDGHTVVSYTSLWTYYQTVEVDNYFENDGSPLDVYSENPTGADPYNWTFVTNQCGTYGVEGDCYNREHSFPQSWFNEASPMVTDIFHIYLTDGKVNGMRSSWPFGETSAATWTSQNGSKVGPSSYPGYSGTIFEPLDEFKGDFARTYFYMATRYEDVITGWNSVILDGTSDHVYTDWHLNMLMEWHTNDPVSQKELDRNDNIYTSVQHNRNPFIDHPEYAGIIWAGATPVPSINFATASQFVEENSGLNTILLSITEAIPDDVTVNLTITGTATNVDDYTISQTSLFFPASSTSDQSSALTIVDDVDPEDFESIILTIDNLITDNTEIVIGNSDEITFTINNSDGFDETPPTVLSHSIIDSTGLVLSLSENLDPVTSQIATNYFVDNGLGNPISAVLGYQGDSTKVVLTFILIQEDINYKLTINNVEDLAGNPIVTNTTVNFGIFTVGGEGWIEYFEDATFSSYYTGTVTYPTGEWDLVSVYLEPAAESYEGEHAVRMNDDTVGASITTPAINGVDSVIFQYRALNADPVSTFKLQKSVDGGAFTDVATGTFSEAVYYEFTCKVNDPSENIRLRVLNDDQLAHLIVDNFEIVTFSGPVQDTTPPEISSHVVTDSTLIITFSELLDPITSQTLTNYVLDNGVGNPDTAVLGYGGDSTIVEVFFPAFTEDVNYQLTINNVEDLAGNPIATNTTVDFIINSTGGGGEGWIEYFEDATWSSYTTGTYTYPTGDWDFVAVYLEPVSEAYEGDHAVRMDDDTSGASITSPAINGVDSVIFQYRALHADPVSTFKLQKSVDGGAFTDVTTGTFSEAVYYEFAYKVNDTSDNIRIRVLNDDQVGHLIVDHFEVVTFAVAAPETPANVSTQINGSDITISWDPVSGAAKYDVYSSNLPYTGFAWEASVTTEEYIVACTDAKKFYYILANTEGIKLKAGESHERFIDMKKAKNMAK